MRSFDFDDSWDDGADGGGSSEALVFMTVGMDLLGVSEGSTWV